jgi:tetratricopeptide (TPR) repeat protein
MMPDLPVEAMRFPRLRPIITLALVCAVILGGTAITYARLARPLLDADEALAADEPERALAAYAEAETRLRRVPFVQQILARDYARATYNQMALLYRAGAYDAVLAKAESSPEGASPRFWIGCALFAQAMAEESPEARLVGLSRAEEEFKRALDAAPDDWDTKYNYEVTARLAAELRRQPKTEPDTLLQLLRPEPQKSAPTRRTG